MSLLKRLMVLFVILMMALSIGSVSALAVTNQDNCSDTMSIESIEPRADVIVLKYRIYDGVFQYRRWNETQNCWVDPDWIDL